MFVEPGKPMLFGENKEKMVSFENGRYQVEILKEQAEAPQSAVLNENATNGELLSLLETTEKGFPVVTGILRQQVRPTLDGAVNAQISSEKQNQAQASLANLLQDADTWEHDH